jgi:hypothetical protein
VTNVTLAFQEFGNAPGDFLPREKALAVSAALLEVLAASA